MMKKKEGQRSVIWYMWRKKEGREKKRGMEKKTGGGRERERIRVSCVKVKYFYHGNEITSQIR